MTTNDNKNLISIDVFRAIAALGVYIYHQGIFSLFAHYTHINALSFFTYFGANYAVPLFFLISGYCIHLSHVKQLRLNKPLELKKYFKRRLLRIYPTYFFALIFSIIVAVLTSYGSMPSVKDFFVHVFCFQGFTIKYFNSINLVLWTISVEIAFYILYPIFYYIRLKTTLNTALFFAFITSCVSIIYFSLQKEISVIQYYCVLNIWFAWCVGAYLANMLFSDPHFFRTHIFKIGYLIILLIFIYLEMHQTEKLSVLYYQFKILIWIGPLTYLLSKEKWLNNHNNFFIKKVKCIGLSSYSLYLLHEPLISLKNYLIHSYLPVVFQPPAMIIAIIFIPYVTWLSYLYIERPFMFKKTKLVA